MKTSFYPVSLVLQIWCIGLLYLAGGYTAVAQGNNCNNPLLITALPFNQTNLTNCGFGDSFDLPGGSGCGNGSYLQGQEIVYQLTPAVSGCFNIQLYNVTGIPDAGIFVFSACPGAGNICVGSSAGQTAPFLKIDLVAGTPYYIVIGSQQTFFSNCNGFSLYISNPEQAPVNDFCENALTLTGLGSNYNATACNEPNEWTPDFNSIFFNQCTGGQWNFNHNGVWYVFENPEQQTVSIEIFNIQCIGVIANPTLQIGVWSNNGTCNLADESFYGCLVTTGNAVLNLNNLPAGNFYLFVDGSSGSLCTWEFASQQVITCYPPQLTPVSALAYTLCANQLSPVTFSIDTIGTQPAHLYWLLNTDTLQTEGLTFTTTPTQSGTYTALMHNGCGSEQINFMVTVIEPPTATISGGGNICLNQPQDVAVAITLTGVPPFEVQYQLNGEPQPPISGITGFSFSFFAQTEGNYQLTQVADALCPSGTAQGTATITATGFLDAPVLSANEVFICAGNNFPDLSVLNVVAGAAVNWFTQFPVGGTPFFSGNVLNANDWFSNTQPDTLTVWVQQTVNGCISDATPVAIGIIPLPQLVLPILPDVCLYEPIPQISLTTNATVTWYANNPQTGAMPITSGVTLNPGAWIDSNASGAFTFWATATQNGCTSLPAETTFQVLALPPPPAATGSQVCPNEPLPTLTATATGNITWYADTAQTLPIALGNTFLPDAAGTYYLRQTDPAIGCTSGWAAVEVGYYLPPLPPLATGSQVCPNEPLPTLTATATGNITWYADTAQTLPIALGNTFLPDAAGTYYLRQTDPATGCTSGWAAVEVGYYLPPLPPLATGAQVCPNEPLPTLTATATGNITWYADTAQTLPIALGNTFLPDAAGTYYLHQTDPATGCTSGWAAVEVVVIPYTQAPFSYPQTVYCLQNVYSQAPTFTNPPVLGGIFSISGNAVIDSVSGIINLQSTPLQQPYTITYLPNAQCPLPTQFVLETADIVLPTLPELLVEEGRPITINATAMLGQEPISYVWQPVNGLSCTTCPVTSLAPWQNQYLTLTATDANGCTATATAAISVYPRPNLTVLPNAFSPNGDGVNDVFRPVAYHIERFEISLYNRWGELVFAATNPDVGWNGEYRNQPAPMGVYVYYATITYQNGQTEQLKGNVTLVR